jgi:hypothetical protein
MTNGVAKCTVVLTVLVAASSCGRPITKSDLTGTYVADFGFATDSLSINEDGGFTQTIKVKADSKLTTANGKWRFDPRAREIHFSEFMVVINGFGEMVRDFDDPRKRGPQFAPVRRVLGKLEIGGDDLPWGRRGAEVPYKKVEASAKPRPTTAP